MVTELEHDCSGLRDVAVAVPGGSHRESVLVDDLLLEVVSIQCCLNFRVIAFYKTGVVKINRVIQTGLDSLNKSRDSGFFF